MSTTASATTPSAGPDQGRRCPVTFDAGNGLWRLHRLGDVRRALLDPAFAVDNALTAITPIADPALRLLAEAGVTLPPALANNGSPTHAPLRRLVNSYVEGARVRALVPTIEGLAREHVAAAQARLDAAGEVDLVASVTRELPARVLVELLGLPDHQRPRPSTLHQWGESAFELFWGWPDEARQAELAVDVADCHTWLMTHLRAARRSGDDRSDRSGFLDALAHVRDDHGRPLPLRVAASAGFFTVLAGQQTTGYLIARVLQRVLRSPGLAAQIAANPARVRQVVEETLREQSPVPTWRRVTTRPVTVAGMKLPAGAHVLVSLNDPGAPTHLAFGTGAHRCPGAALARTEAATVLGVAAPLLARTRLANPTDDPEHEVDLLSFSAPRRLRIVPA